MFEGFDERHIETDETRILVRTAGSGPPVLLLHGYPQTSAMWCRVAPRLMGTFTVVCADLRGYGRSGKPESDARHAAYSKRAMAKDMVEVMAALGFRSFAVAGHDRGGRVTHRLCLDHPDRVTRAAVLDIVPTRTLFERTNQALATGYYHWYFLIQPDDLPERLIGHDPRYWLHHKLSHWSKDKTAGFYDPEAIAEYERCFDEATIHASCEDYRAAASIDLEHDRTDDGRRIACPLLALWGEFGLMHRHFDVLATWREKAGQVEGRALPCGHFLPEEKPEATADALEAFFGQ